MAKDETVYFRHMLDQAERVVEKVRGRSRADFDSDENRQLALVHLIQTIGEAARVVSPGTKSLYPEIPWGQITGMCHRIVHDYLKVDQDVVWDVATEHLAALIDQRSKIIATFPSE